MAKPNGKSVRLSNEVLAIVEKAPGEGFNDKFEKLIFAYSNSIPNRLAQLTSIDRQIAAKRKEFDALKSLEYKVSFMVRQLASIGDLISVASNVSHELAQAATGLKVNEIQDFEQMVLEGGN